jgi:t-SNARE complex subunit (syntaxin)
MPGDQRRDVEHELEFGKQRDRKHPSPAQQSMSDPNVWVRNVVVIIVVVIVIIVVVVVIGWLVGELDLDLI